MKGKILDFNIQKGEGVISGDDSQRYNFVAAEWKSLDSHPSRNIEVDFSVVEGNATAIYAVAPVVVTNTNNDAKSAWKHYTDAVLRNYANFKGRADKSAFWWFQLVSICISIALSLISAGTLGLLYSLAIMIPALALGARRLHDTGKSGWWQLVMLIPLIGIIVLIIFWIQTSDPQKNQYDN